MNLRLTLKNSSTGQSQYDAGPNCRITPGIVGVAVKMAGRCMYVIPWGEVASCQPHGEDAKTETVPDWLGAEAPEPPRQEQRTLPQGQGRR
jgi:hypothetical protein